MADPICRGLGLRPLDCWERGFEFRYGHEYLCLCLLCIV
jgi:hypothetical protein